MQFVILDRPNTFCGSERMKRVAVDANPVVVRLLGGLLVLISQRLILVGEEPGVKRLCTDGHCRPFPTGKGFLFIGSASYSYSSSYSYACHGVGVRERGRGRKLTAEPLWALFTRRPVLCSKPIKTDNSGQA